MTTPAIGPLCDLCKHLHRDLTCDAFPRGIPAVIYAARASHETPIKGDHGIVFEPLPNGERARFDDPGPELA